MKGCLEDLREKKEVEIRKKERRSDATTEVQKKDGRIVEDWINEAGNEKGYWRWGYDGK